MNTSRLLHMICISIYELHMKPSHELYIWLVSLYMNYIWCHVTNSTHDLYPDIWISHVTNSTYDLHLYIYITYEVKSRTLRMTWIFACKLHMKSRHELYIWLVSHELYVWLVSLEGNDSCVRVYLHIEIHIMWISHELCIWTSHVTNSTYDLYLYMWIIYEVTSQTRHMTCKSRTLHMTCIASR